MISVEQDFGNRQAAELARSRELRIFEKSAFGKRFVLVRGLIAEHARNEPDDGINQEHRRHFAAVADEIANRDLQWLQTLSDSVIESFVSPAQQKQPFVLSEFLHQFLRQ